MLSFRPTRRLDLRSIAVFLGAAWGLVFILLALDTNLSKPRFFEQSDYVMSFYIAGRLVAAGQAAKLYPEPHHQSFTHSPFNQAAHRLLPGLQPEATAVFMYNPIVAWIFVPLAGMSPHLSMLSWQALSIGSMIVSMLFVARVLTMSSADAVFTSFLFLPVIATLWAGQVSLLMGLLPLTLGLYLLFRGHSFLAGLAWSLLALKPQFLFLPGALVLGLALARRFDCGSGFLAGLAGLIIMNILLIPLHIVERWIYSMRLGQAFFTAESHQIREYLITSLPANFLLTLPFEMRESFQAAAYAFAAALWFSGAWHCSKVIESNLPESLKIQVIFAGAAMLLPLTAPYLLYYDLCLLLPAGVMLMSHRWPESIVSSCKAIGILAWSCIGVYMIAFVTLSPRWVQPLALQLVLLMLWIFWLKTTLGLTIGSQATGSCA